MQNHYEFNVALRGRHLFATAERSCTTQEKASALGAVLAAKFPASEGYEVTCTLWVVRGTKFVPPQA